jgi:divinyl protochlorophyllide a 8-vinyl-reductase
MGRTEGRARAAHSAAPRIGPNSLLQTLRALRELEAPDLAAQVPASAELPETWPEGMVPEVWFARLVTSLREALPRERSESVLYRSGSYTADYVGQNRIPAPFRALLRILPARLGVPLLLAAFRRHAWTFAGAGRFSVEGSFPGTIVLDGCPTCRKETSARIVEGRAGAYYEAAFEGLLSLAARGVRVREIACQARGEPLCRFQIAIEANPSGAPCASS